MNLKKLIVDITKAVREGRWLDVARLCADALKAGADLGEVLFGGAEVKKTASVRGKAAAKKPPAEVTDEDLAELETAVAEAKATPHVAAEGKMDPGMVISLVTIVLELIKQWRARK